MTWEFLGSLLLMTFAPSIEVQNFRDSIASYSVYIIYYHGNCITLYLLLLFKTLMLCYSINFFLISYSSITKKKKSWSVKDSNLLGISLQQ